MGISREDELAGFNPRGMHPDPNGTKAFEGDSRLSSCQRRSSSWPEIDGALCLKYDPESVRLFYCVFCNHSAQEDQDLLKH